MKLSRNKIISISIGIVVVGLIAWWWIYLLIPRSTLYLRVAPQEVTITNEGGDTKFSGTYHNNDKLTISPGTYKFTVSRDEFKSYTTTVTLKDGETGKLLTALTPLTDAAKELLNNDDSQAVIEEFEGLLQSQGEEKLTTDYPILTVLPINERLYKIDACESVKHPDDFTKIAICIYEKDESLKPYALNAIKSAGYNPDDYEIRYILQ